ncbi:MAG: hypothetical protein LBC45_01855 [Chlamydiales bacterium]|jgi:RHS repeat-associated protein|nr:hypothetical protein [Chlamydiales bacterium]
MRYLLNLIVSFFCFANAFTSESLSQIYLGSREGDPTSLVENVSTIHGDYSEYEVDLVVPGPDSLVLSRCYSSKDSLSVATLGGWRFYPQCFLTTQKDPKGKTYTTSEGTFDRAYAYVGTSEGSILTYVGWHNQSNPQAKSLFKVDVEERLLGITNSARAAITSWTNLKNNELCFDSQNNSFELFLNNGGKRFYIKHPSLNFYILKREILPSGNKIFYEYNDRCHPVLIKMTNSSEKKVLGWIRIQYGSTIHIDSSDGQTVDYQLEQDPTGELLLTKVARSNKPSVHYQYNIVDGRAFLTRKDLPEGRFTEVDYYTNHTNRNKVKSVTTPAGVSGSTSTQFVYGLEADGSGFTEIYGPLHRKIVHRFNEDLQLVCVEQYLGKSVYRIQRRTWGKRRDVTNLMSTTIEDENGNVYYAKTLSYDDKGNVLEEREYGNLTGASPHPIAMNDEGISGASQEFHVKTYFYYTIDEIDIINQKDAKGNGIRLGYKKGTNLLLRKCILEKNNRKKRWFYDYDEDGALTRVVVDDGYEVDAKSTDCVHKRHITQMTPKKDLPHVGAPEIVEEKYLDVKKKKEVLLKRMVNHFDAQGNIHAQDIYDANEEHRYVLKKIYEAGLLKVESDPAGNEVTYSYDGNHNLITEVHSRTGTSFEYGYDLKNRLIYTAEKDAKGNVFETHTSYDPSGYKLSEIDKLGNEIIYRPDDLGRVQSVSYPEIKYGENLSVKPTYTYQYDLFDHAISVTDPRGKTTLKTYTLRGQPTRVQYPDGIQELFKYDAEGSLHRYLSKDGTVRVFEYDYLGRIGHIEHYARISKKLGRSFSNIRYSNIRYSYDAFHMTFEKDELGNTTTYTYDGGGRLTSLSKDSRKVEFFYDPLGRTKAVKKWKTARAFTLQVREYDLLDHVTEERVEDSEGNTVLKYKYVYDEAGFLKEVIGYPQNQESTIKKYDYDGFGRLIAIRDAFNQITEIIYDDAHVNEWGQKVAKRTEIDPLGNQKEEIFDTSGHLTKVTQRNEKGQILAESELIYDAIGNELLEKNAVIFSGELLRTYTTEQTYSPGNQLQTLTHAATSPDERRISFTYNSYGDVLTKLEPGAKTPIAYQYNNGGKLESIAYQEEASDKKITHKLSYDKKGNITEVRLGSTHTVTYTFDPNSQLTSETIQDEFGSYHIGYTLDGEGLIQSIQLPDGSFVEYDYAGHFVKQVSRFTKGKKELYSYRIASRDLMGNVLEEILIGHAGARTQKWDQAGRRIEVSTDFFQDKIPEGGYDPLQNIRKREIVLDDEKYTIDYDYDDLSHLIAEKGEIEHSYSFDSLGNRLKKDESFYKINDLNQVLTAHDVIYTFDLNGNLASKTMAEKTWIFQHNALNQLISIKDPNQTNITFTYDLSGRRLSKKVEGKKKKSKVLRYFYMGQTEIGCLDERGVIVELRIPSDPNYPEAAPFISAEIKGGIYAPIYDLQGNVTCLVDPEYRQVVEGYRYSAFGEEEIINERGRSVSDSTMGNPWRYRGKRIDKEVGLINFGHRYYDPETGRWINPDPAGNIDGPNLYAFCHNNPLSYVDYFGHASEANHEVVDEKYFYGEYEPLCPCEHHRDCKRGGDLTNAIGGISHGLVDFILGSLHDLQTANVYIGSGEMEMTLEERVLLIDAVERSQANQMAVVGSWTISRMFVDESDAVYQSFRSKTTTTLEISSLVTGGYGVIKGIIGFSKLAKIPINITRKHIINEILGRGFFIRNFKYTNTTRKHMNEIVKRGPFKGTLSRPYMQSPHTINEIMASRKPIPDPGGISGGLRWDVPGTFRGSEGTWELIIHPETEMIYHFNFK